MKFLIINQHSLNYGDDIAGIALIQELKKRFPNNLHIDIIYNTKGKLPIDEENVEHRFDLTLKKVGKIQLFIFYFFSLFGLKIIFDDTLREFRKTIQEADKIFVSPSGANIGIYKDWRFLLKVWMVDVFEGDLVFHNNTIGKSGHLLFDRIAAKILRRSDIYVRELSSYQYLKKQRISSVRTVDTGFMFKNVKISPEYIQNKKNYIVFIPAKLSNWHPNFKNSNVEEKLQEVIIPELIEFLECNKQKIVFLPHMYGESNEDDLLLNYKQHFLDAGLEEKQILDIKVHDCFDYDLIISNSSAVVSMRYHGVIMAIKNAIPFISLAYENKMKEACIYSNLQLFNMDISVGEFSAFREKIEYLWAHKSDIEKSMEISQGHLVDLASVCLNQLEFVKKGNIQFE